MNLHKSYSHLILLWVTLFLSSCVTQKQKGDLSALGKAYHNTTARYNGYFNANEILEASFLNLESQLSDNYNQILPIFKYVNAENPQAVSAELDEAIKKVSIVVGLHRDSRWADDCYLLMGKAQFLQQDYEAAEQTLRYLVNEYDPSLLKLKEAKKNSDKEKQSSKKTKKEVNKEIKEREKQRVAYNKAVKKARKKGIKAPSRKDFMGESNKDEEVVELNEEPIPAPIPALTRDEKQSMLKHNPAFREGQLWLAKTMIERDNNEGAKRLLEDLENYANFTPELQSEFHAVKAYYYFKLKEYEDALPEIEKASEYSVDNILKARMAFITAQLHQINKNNEAALQYFQLAKKFNTDPEMEFFAALNIAMNASGSPQKAKENLEKMLNDEKNEIYADQIYHALGVLELETGQQEEAIALFLKALETSQNSSRNLETFLVLAELYFDNEDFVAAKDYYQKALGAMSNLDVRYSEVKAMNENLDEIAKNINIINLQDSLLKLSEMSPEELKEVAALQKAKSIEEANAAEEEEPDNNPMLQGRNGNRKLNTLGRTGISNLTVSLQSSFFAYDEKALARGKRDFERKWGDRPLSDNWRRQEAIANLPIASLEEEVIEEVPIPLLTDDEVADIIGTLPTSPEAKISAGLKIQEAMFNLGVLYRNKLSNNEATIRILKELLDRFPKNNYEPEAMYFLYIAYTDIGNNSQAGYYKRSIIAKFPGSKFAEVLTNPNYLAELEDEEKRLNNYYDEAYRWFVEGSYKRAFDMVLQARSEFPPQNKYQAKFALLGAMCQGNLEGEEQYKRALREVVGKYPNTEEQSRAREILRLLGDAIAALPGNAKGDAERFKDEPDQIHYIVISIEDDSDVLNKAKIAVSNYHMQYHKLDKLRISNLYLGSNEGERFPLLVIRKFENKEAAMKYYLAAKRNQKDFIDGKVAYAVFPMSQNNYREILRSKSLDGYNEFFNSYYY